MIEMDAKISECGLYRYELTRHWSEGRGICTFVMCNPSTADASHDDPTMDMQLIVFIIPTGSEERHEA